MTFSLFSDRAIHARHAEVSKGRQFVARSALDFATRPPQRVKRGDRVLAVQIEDCFICRPRASRCTTGIDTIKVNMTSTADSSFAITKAVTSGLVSESSQPRELAANTSTAVLTHSLLRQATPPTPHPPRTKQDSLNQSS